jgi:hypothetical protein
MLFIILLGNFIVEKHGMRLNRTGRRSGRSAESQKILRLAFWPVEQVGANGRHFVFSPLSLFDAVLRGGQRGKAAGRKRLLRMLISLFLLDERLIVLIDRPLWPRNEPEIAAGRSVNKSSWPSFFQNLTGQIGGGEADFWRGEADVRRIGQMSFGEDERVSKKTSASPRRRARPGEDKRVRRGQVEMFFLRPKKKKSDQARERA